MAKRIQSTCKLCGKQFLGWRSTQQFCSKRCAATGESNNAYRHGKTSSGTYKIWGGMISRMKHPNQYYKHLDYDPRWNDFSNFLADMGERPDGMSIDRIDNSRGYWPENCRWATKYEQMNNTRQNKYITFNNMTLTQEQWGRLTGIGGTTICKRLKRGWSIEKTLTTNLMR